MRRSVPVVAAALLVGALWAGTGDAAVSPPLPDISTGATASVLAVRAPIVTESVSVAETSNLSPAVEAAAAQAALQAGGAAMPGRSASIGMTSVVRGGAAVQAANPRARPVSTNTARTTAVRCCLGHC